MPRITEQIRHALLELKKKHRRWAEVEKITGVENSLFGRWVSGKIELINEDNWAGRLPHLREWLASSAHVTDQFDELLGAAAVPVAVVVKGRMAKANQAFVRLAGAELESDLAGRELASLGLAMGPSQTEGSAQGEPILATMRTLDGGNRELGSS